MLLFNGLTNRVGRKTAAIDLQKAHSPAVVVAKLKEFKFHLVRNLPYSLESAALNFYLFPNMKK